MANSRFDNIKYWDGSSFKIPQQIKVYDGSSWVDLGTKNSFNTKKLNAYNGSNFFCATYYRHDVDIPKTIQIGSGKYLSMYKGDSTTCSIDSYVSGYSWEMTVEVNSTTPLYTCYLKNKGDIYKYAYVNYVAEVSGNSARLRVKTRFYGKSVSGSHVNSTETKYTSYAWTKGEKVRIVITKPNTSTTSNIKIYNPNGTLICDENLFESRIQVWTPDIHRIGSETVNDAGSQSTYGDAKIYNMKFTPNNTRGLFIIDFTAQSNGATRIYSSGSASGWVDASGTSVYGSQYTEYIRQTI